MLNCKIHTGYLNPCETSMGGVKRLAIANWSPDHDFVNSTGDCEVDTISLDGEEVFYELQVLEGTGSASAELQTGSTVDQKYLLHTVAGTIGKLNCDLLEDFDKFILAKVIFAVEDKNGDVFIYGEKNGLQADTFNYTTGAAEGDAHGISFSYSGGQPCAPVKVASWDVVKSVMAQN